MAGLRLAGQLGVGRCCNQAFALTTGGQGVLAVFEHFEPTLLARPSPRSYFMKCFSNRTCERFAPFSVSKTDFAFVAGSEM